MDNGLYEKCQRDHSDKQKQRDLDREVAQRKWEMLQKMALKALEGRDLCEDEKAALRDCQS